MKIKFYNTLSRKKEVFKPIEKGKAKIYTCGPTVYSFPTIGNMRSYVFADLLKRVLVFNGYKVKHIINVTDVGHLTSDADEGEDKIEQAARKEKKAADEIAEFYFNAFKKDLRKLNILFPDKFPKATEHIKEQINLIKKLEEKGFAYKTSDGIYFDSSKFRNYGKLARLKIEGLEAGKRVSKREKKNKTDFALWKFSSEKDRRQQEWNSPWGNGFPGWHIECSAMSMKYLGKRFDIHTGGEDHVSVHHTNEIAQSEAFTGKKFVNYWMHVAFLVHKGEKVSKSRGGLYTVSELEEKGYKPEHFRYLCLLTHYRKQMDFSLKNLDSARNAYEKIRRKVIELKSQEHKGADYTGKYRDSFLRAVNDDLNTPLAVQVFLEALESDVFDSGKKIKLLEGFDRVLGLRLKEMEEEEVKVPEEVKRLIKEREKLRKAEEWEKADIIRNKIRRKGFEIEDTEKGARIKYSFNHNL